MEFFIHSRCSALAGRRPRRYLQHGGTHSRSRGCSVKASAQAGRCATFAKQVADSTKERQTKRPLKYVFEEFETKVIAAASKLQEQLANNAEQPDAPAAAAQSAIDARSRKRDAEVDDVLTPSQPPTAKARSSKTAKKRNLASSSAAPHVPESDSHDGARRQAPTAKARSSKMASNWNLASSSEAPLLLAADTDDDGAVLNELKKGNRNRDSSH